MARYFTVKVDHFSSIIEEVQTPLNVVDWACRVNGEPFQYRIFKDGQGSIKNWFERGTNEIMYHAQTNARGGFILWDKRPKAPAKLSKAKKAALEKMVKLL